MELNIAHSEFAGQQGGLMICGYEWGGGGEEDSAVANAIDGAAVCTFANKELRYGPAARGWRYDNRIKQWFKIWDRELDNDNPGMFEKSIVQTNWCNTQNPRMDGNYQPLWEPSQVANFLMHVAHFSPRLILFMGSKLIEALQYPSTLEQFEALVGKCTERRKSLQKDFDGRRFKISFQTFEQCDVVCLPHPSGSLGLSDTYIKLFSDKMGELLRRYEHRREVDALERIERKIVDRIASRSS